LVARTASFLRLFSKKKQNGPISLPTYLTESEIETETAWTGLRHDITFPVFIVVPVSLSYRIKPDFGSICGATAEASQQANCQSYMPGCFHI